MALSRNLEVTVRQNVQLWLDKASTPLRDVGIDPDRVLYMFLAERHPAATWLSSWFVEFYWLVLTSEALFMVRRSRVNAFKKFSVMECSLADIEGVVTKKGAFSESLVLQFVDGHRVKYESIDKGLGEPLVRAIREGSHVFARSED